MDTIDFVNILLVSLSLLYNVFLHIRHSRCQSGCINCDIENQQVHQVRQQDKYTTTSTQTSTKTSTKTSI